MEPAAAADTHEAGSWEREARALIVLAVPVMLTQLAQMALGVTDMLMLGHAGVQAMASAALANSYGFVVMMMGVGVVFGIDPLVTQAHGARDRDALALALQRGVLIALAVSVPIMIAWYNAGAALCQFGEPPELAEAAGGYLRAQLWSVPFFPLLMAFRQYLQGRGIVRPGLLVLLAENVVNALLDWAFIFGHLGLPALGLRGAGIAAGITRAFGLLLLIAFIVVGRLHEGAWRPWSRKSVQLSGLLEVLRLGLPIGLQWGMEVLAFSGSAMFAGWMGETAVSAYTVVLNVASVTFMLPLGIGIGASIRVGNLVGEGREAAVRRTAKLALVLGIGVMACCGVLMVLLRNLLPHAFTTDTRVIALSASIFPVAALFQIFDGTQVVSGGILRGLGRTRAPALVNFIGYYVVGLPVGYWLAFHAGLGVVGLWWGLLIGLVIVGVSLASWVRVSLRKPLLRVAGVVGDPS